jgi:hypothetical protein
MRSIVTFPYMLTMYFGYVHPSKLLSFFFKRYWDLNLGLTC